MTRAYSQVSLLAGDLGLGAKAQQYLEKQLELARAAKDRQGVEIATENLALHYGFMGDPETGLRILRQEMTQLAPDDEVSLGRFQANLAALTKMTGRYAEAESYYLEALRHSQSPESWE